MKTGFLAFLGSKSIILEVSKRGPKKRRKNTIFFIFFRPNIKKRGKTAFQAIFPTLFHHWRRISLHHAENADADVPLGILKVLEQRFALKHHLAARHRGVEQIRVALIIDNDNAVVRHIQALD